MMIMTAILAFAIMKRKPASPVVVVPVRPPCNRKGYNHADKVAHAADRLPGPQAGFCTGGRWRFEDDASGLLLFRLFPLWRAAANSKDQYPWVEAWRVFHMKLVPHVSPARKYPKAYCQHSMRDG